jgi:hypothetical protein
MTQGKNRSKRPFAFITDSGARFFHQKSAAERIGFVSEWDSPMGPSSIEGMTVLPASESQAAPPLKSADRDFAVNRVKVRGQAPPAVEFTGQ